MLVENESAPDKQMGSTQQNFVKTADKIDSVEKLAGEIMSKGE